MMSTAKININSMEMLKNFSFQCEICLATLVVDFDQICCQSIILHLKREKEKKDKIKKVVHELFSLLNE